MKNILRALNYFRSDFVRIALVVILLLISIGLNVLKPWPLAVIVDNILGGKPYPSWLPERIAGWNQATQLTVLIGTLLTLHLGHALVSAAQLYLSIGVGLRGLCRVRNEVFGWLQRLSLRFHHGTQAGDIIFRVGTDTCAFQGLFQQGLLISITAFCTLLQSSRTRGHPRDTELHAGTTRAADQQAPNRTGATAHHVPARSGRYL
jgi:ATP-binding cassette subfamily B protein